MTPFLSVPDPDDRPSRLRRDAAARRLARQARTRSVLGGGHVFRSAPGNDAA